MKKLLILSAVVLFGLSSCKKDWTCKCEDDDGDVYWQTISNTSKDDAESLCSDYEGDNEDCALLGN